LLAATEQPGKERRIRNDSFFQQKGRPGAVGIFSMALAYPVPTFRYQN
jgi:hypothetical protein